MAKKKTDPPAIPAPGTQAPTDSDLVARLEKLEAWCKDAKDRLPNLPEPPAT